MNLLEAKEYIHSHLHQLDENLIKEVYEKVFTFMAQENPIVGFDVKTKNPIFKKSYKQELNKRINDMENGHFVSHNDVKNMAKEW